jgi:hypothetical protein
MSWLVFMMIQLFGIHTKSISDHEPVVDDNLYKFDGGSEQAVVALVFRFKQSQ